MPRRVDRPEDFWANIRIFSYNESGRKLPVFNGIRWDFCYADDSPPDALWTIWPDFVDSAGLTFAESTPLPTNEILAARMYILNDELRRTVHRHRLKLGTRFYCCEGPNKMAEGVVMKIVSLSES